MPDQSDWRCDAKGKSLFAMLLPPHIQSIQKLPAAFDLPDEAIVLEDIEKKLIHRAIEKAGGNKSKAAKLLGITRRKLYSMLERLG